MYKHLSVGRIKQKCADFFDMVCPYEDFLSFGIIRDPVRRIVFKFNYCSTFKPAHPYYCGDMNFDEFIFHILVQNLRLPDGKRKQYSRRRRSLKKEQFQLFLLIPPASAGGGSVLWINGMGMA
jgi:hypothetical protein